MVELQYQCVCVILYMSVITQNKWSALTEAAWEGKAEVVVELGKAGANVDMQNEVCQYMYIYMYVVHDVQCTYIHVYVHVHVCTYVYTYVYLTLTLSYVFLGFDFCIYKVTVHVAAVGVIIKFPFRFCYRSVF